MIAVVEVCVNAANPEMPLFPLRAVLNSPSSIRVRNVPKKVGTWQLTKVYFTAAYPDNSVKTADCVLAGGVWVGTIEGSTAPGYSENGYTIFADGVDENGNEVAGYVLGRGDVKILDADGSITPGETSYYVHMLSAEPAAPKDGDLWQLSGSWFICQDGQAWPIGDDSGLIDAVSAKVDVLSAQLSAKADKQIVETEVKTYELPNQWYFEEYGTTLFEDRIEGTTVFWGDSDATLAYDVVTEEIALDYQGKHISFGHYSVDDLKQHVEDMMPIDWTDEQTGMTYYIYPQSLYQYSIETPVEKDVVYAAGGYSGIEAALSAKQDALDNAQLSAVDSGITSAKVAAYDAALSNQVELAEDVTYAQLVALAGQSKLVPGMAYQITDYQTTTVQVNTSADNQVDPIVVRAATTTQLAPEGYMPSKRCEIKYDVNNDTSRYAWADTANGKGVIYWMRDSYGNECPYDFKHILFKPYDPTSNPRTSWHYTFSTHSSSNIIDASEIGYAANNVIMPALFSNATSYSIGSLQRLNNIVLYASTSSNGCFSNYFGQNCADIAIGVSMKGYTGGCTGNWFGPACSRIFSLGNFSYNKFNGGNNRIYVGYNFSYNTLGPAVTSITFGNSVDDLKSYWSYNDFYGPILGLNITTSQTTSSSQQIRGNIFGKYLAYTSGSAAVPTLDIQTVGQSYQITYQRAGSTTIDFN